jgi:hypothetical protein
MVEPMRWGRRRAAKASEESGGSGLGFDGRADAVGQEKSGEGEQGEWRRQAKVGEGRGTR